MTDDCIYCEPVCFDAENGLSHAGDCPTLTGVYPIREEDFGPKCVHCGNRAFGDGIRCIDCGSELKIGDHYMHREVEAGDPLLPGAEGAPIYEVICVGCAAKEALNG